MVDMITENRCKEILYRHNPSFIFNSYGVKRLEKESVNGLIGLHYILCINYTYKNERQTLQLFVKTLNDHSKTMLKISKDFQFYEKEKLFFMDLIPKYKDMGIDVSFAPNAYLCEGNAVILEDLRLTNFKLFPRKESLDLAHCRACLFALAQFHSSSLLYQILKFQNSGTKYSILEDYSDILQDLIYSTENADAKKYFQKSVEAVIVLAKLEFDDNEFIDELKKMSSHKKALQYDDLCCVILHGDLWSNNFLHQYNGENIRAKLVDYQTVYYGPPCLDVLQFIHSNTRRELRNKHLKDLLSFYYKTLENIFRERSLSLADYLPENQFLYSYSKFEARVKLNAIVDRCLTAIPDEALRKTASDEKKLNDFLFVNRNNYLVDLYNSIPMYKELVSEDLRELKDMLYKPK